jgi:hypothetical protein
MRPPRVRHISICINPVEAGLHPYRVTFTRAASGPVPSLLDEGLWYTHPEREETVIVWAQDAAAIAAVLTYHYQDSWSHLRVLLDVP